LVCDITVSQYPGQITEVSSELAALGYQTVVACGGDGTVNELVNGIAGTPTALGVVPMGAANDFAANMGISKDINLACKMIKEGRTRKIDLVKVRDDKFFAGTGCIGFDAEVAAFASGRKENSSPFLWRVLGALLKFVSYRAKTVELRFNGDRYFGEVLLVAFGNVRSYARGKPMTPGAAPDDASLDICVVRPIPRWKLFSFFPSVYKRAHVNNKRVTVSQAGSVYVQSVGPMALYADGDFMTTTPFRLEVMPRHLNVIVGPASS
jgi:YegS/Rv2252/BmrU family lipid kinase